LQWRCLVASSWPVHLLGSCSRRFSLRLDRRVAGTATSDVLDKPMVNLMLLLRVVRCVDTNLIMLSVIECDKGPRSLEGMAFSSDHHSAMANFCFRPGAHTPPNAFPSTLARPSDRCNAHGMYPRKEICTHAERGYCSITEHIPPSCSAVYSIVTLSHHSRPPPVNPATISFLSIVTFHNLIVSLSTKTLGTCSP
jgi:hypothetical protein